MSLDEIVDATVTSDSVTVSQAGFSRVLIVGEFATSIFANRTKSYSDPAEVANDFSTDSAIYKAAQAAYSDPQDINPDEILVGRRPPGTAQVYSIDCTAPSSGEGTIAVSVDGIQIVQVDVESTDTNSDIADRLKSAINNQAAQPFVAVDSSTTSEVDLESQYASNDYNVTSATTGTGTGASVTEATSPSTSSESITDTLDAIWNETKDFFGLCLVSTVQAEQEAAAAWAESKPMLASFRTNDPDGTGALDSTSTTDLLAKLSASNYAQTYATFTHLPWRFPDVCTLACRLAVDPDESSTTWHLYQPGGIEATDLDTDEKNAIEDKNGNHITEVGGLTVLREGVSAAGEFIDITVSSFWLQARLQERVFGLLAGEVAAGSKVPYTDDGGTALEGELRAQMKVAKDALHVNPDTDPVIQVPERADISDQQVGTREFPAIQAGDEWANAIHSAQFRVTLTN